MRARALMIAVACVSLGLATPAGAADGRPGVTKTEIRVGGVATLTGGVGTDYGGAFAGAQAYFDLVNRHGGVFGRRLRLVARLDDHGQASGNVTANRTLITNTKKKVFAVVPESVREFTGSKLLVTAGTPTFGWNVNLDWSRGPSLFGDTGSYRCFSCPAVPPAFVAHQLGATKVAVLAAASVQDVDCAEGIVASADKYGLNVVVRDDSMSADLRGLADDVTKIRDQGAQLVSTCGFDLDQVLRVAKALDTAKVSNVHVYGGDAYDPRALGHAGRSVRGVFFAVPFVPWERPDGSRGTKQFLAAMKRMNVAPSEAAQAGWIDAQLLVQGIRRAGKGFTQQSVVAAVNAMTGFDADGMLAGIDWTTGGHGPARQICSAFVEAVRGRYVPRYGKPGQPFVCFPDNPVPPALDAPTYAPVTTGGK